MSGAEWRLPRLRLRRDTGRCIAYSLPEVKASPSGGCEEGLALQILDKARRFREEFQFGSFKILGLVPRIKPGLRGKK